MVSETIAPDQKSQTLCTGLEVEALETALSLGVSEEDSTPLHCGTEQFWRSKRQASMAQLTSLFLATKASGRAAVSGLVLNSFPPPTQPSHVSTCSLHHILESLGKLGGILFHGGPRYWFRFYSWNSGTYLYGYEPTTYTVTTQISWIFLAFHLC